MSESSSRNFSSTSRSVSTRVVSRTMRVLTRRTRSRLPVLICECETAQHRTAGKQGTTQLQMHGRAANRMTYTIVAALQAHRHSERVEGGVRRRLQVCRLPLQVLGHLLWAQAKET